jgi:hypothetical protein
MGYCVLKTDPQKPFVITGLAGIDGKAVIMSASIEDKEVSNMPGGDGTGPAGMGPMTGRAAGYCAGYPMPGFANPIPGRGLGFGGGRGFGFGRGSGLGFRGGRGWGGNWRTHYAAPVYPYNTAYGAAIPPYGAPYGGWPTREQESDMLKGQAEYLEDALEGIKKRITELETASNQKK